MSLEVLSLLSGTAPEDAFQREIEARVGDIRAAAPDFDEFMEEVRSFGLHRGIDAFLDEHPGWRDTVEKIRALTPRIRQVPSLTPEEWVEIRDRLRDVAAPNPQDK